jgi:hypothetical protein
VTAIAAITTVIVLLAHPSLPRTGSNHGDANIAD